MARPKVYEEKRITTAIRVPESLHDRLRRLADEREVSVNYVVLKALENYIATARATTDAA